jgi:two-component system sensor histidine kinase CiaH
MEAGGYKLNMEETDFSELVSQCAHDFNVRFPQRIIHTSIQKEVYVIGDLLLLQMAVNNLIDNALKYSPKELPITIQLTESNGKPSLLVMDEGKGIAAEEKNKVFHKFYRIGNASTKAAKGTGLGLYLTKKIVLQHKGNIYLTDNQPKGSIFTIQLNTANAT